MMDESPDTNIAVHFVKPRRASEAQRRSAGVRAMRAMEKGRGAPVTRFRRIMAFARDLAAMDPKGLSLLIAAMGRIVQSQAIVEPILHYPNDTSSSAFWPVALLFSELDSLDAQGRTFGDLAIKSRNMREMRLDRDIVIPNPWQPLRLQRALSKLRLRGGWGRWRQDVLNHQVSLWEPIGIGWVHGGNHSISAGILTASGTIRPNFGYDISPVYEHVVSRRRRAIRRRHDKAVIAEVSSVEMAAIFEIGRLIAADVRAARFEPATEEYEAPTSTWGHGPRKLVQRDRMTSAGSVK